MTIFLLDSLLIQFQPATVLGSRRFLFWQGFWLVWSCSDLLIVFRMVGLFTSPPTNWGLVRVKFQQVNWPWNSKSCVICPPLVEYWLALSVDVSAKYWLTLDHHIGWLSVPIPVERYVGRHSSDMSVGVLTNMSTKTLADTPVSIPVGTRTIQA